MIAKTYGQDPREVAAWAPEWIAAAVTALEAEAGARNEIALRERRKSARTAR